MTEPAVSDLLNAFWDNNLVELSQVPERFVADHYRLRQYCHVSRHAIMYVLQDIERAAVPDPNHFETIAACKSATSDCRKRARKRYLFESAPLKDSTTMRTI